MTFAPPKPKIALTPEQQERLQGLIEILRHARPHDSVGERRFAREYIDRGLGGLPHVSLDIDSFGNRWVTVDRPNALSYPAILWSCHIDTVDRDDRPKGVEISPDDLRTIRLKKKKPGRCLGADDGAGLWLMSEMIRAGVPGVYVFHRGEEVGRLGSLHVANNEAHRLSDFDSCIAFDRRGHHDIITHQGGGERGCSEAFADSLGSILSVSSGGSLDYVADDSGIYTDSYSYFSAIPECTNLSVGYQGEHGPLETLDGLHVLRLRDALCCADFSSIVVERDPTIPEYSYDNFSGYGGYGGWGWPSDRTVGDYDSDVFSALPLDDSELLRDPLEDLCKDHPEVAAELLRAFGLSSMDFLEELSARNVSIQGNTYRSIMEG